MTNKINRLFLIGCFLLIVSTSACQPSATGSPATQIRASATAQPTPLPTTLPSTDTIDLAPFTIHLPAQWPVLHAGDDGWNTQLQQLQSTHPHLTYYIQKLLPNALAETKISVAWNPSPPVDMIVMAAFTPADGLTLQGYVEAITEELEQSRLMVGSAVTVRQAEMRYDLHPKHLPLAFVHYTLSSKTKEQKIAGYQAVMLDSQTDHLLLVTIITSDPVTEEAQVMITSIFRTMAVE